MPTTTNNGWPTPADTDLVKNGADAIRDLGNAIDTTLGVYSPATPGLVKINTTSFSGVTSVSLAANTFTSTYRNYKIVVNITSGSNSSSIRLRASGTDATASNYRYQSVYINSSGSVLNNASSASATSFGGAGMFDAITDGINNINLYNPQLANSTAMDFFSIVGSTGITAFGGGQHDLSVAYDSFTYFSPSNMSGVIRVYGLAN